MKTKIAFLCLWSLLLSLNVWFLWNDIARHDVSWITFTSIAIILASFGFISINATELHQIVKEKQNKGLIKKGNDE